MIYIRVYFFRLHSVIVWVRLGKTRGHKYTKPLLFTDLLCLVECYSASRLGSLIIKHTDIQGMLIIGWRIAGRGSLSLPLQLPLSTPHRFQFRMFRTTQGLYYKIKMGENQPKYKVRMPEEDPIKYRTHGTSFYSLKLENNYRLGNEALYQNPLINFVIGAKRLSLAFGVIGVLFSYLMERTGLVYPEICEALATLSVIPFPVILYLYHPYVSRIFRIYDITKPQTMPNLLKNEQVLIEKLNWNGFKTYNDLIRVDSFWVPSNNDYESRFGYVNLISKDPTTGLKKSYYINEGFCNVKMNRIMALAEKRSHISTGRDLFEK